MAQFDPPEPAKAPPLVIARTTEPGPGTEPGPAPQPAQQEQRVEAPKPEQSPEELLTKLYDPLVRRLKAELWLDRERRGALTDL
ncbi:hypothetical protein BBK82_25130 [Lentzea guizhouensis]|uniref:Uncharacterized protein n=1 Tax=Lentzea guizhouensis TaxID=1586287 RepID=A0A1B2HMB3_9PSEU|nr:hypothetical protein BBK82_25130 [Lentzea guizhouensis]